eukprot:m51a1_g3133 putative atp-dependent rna helicase dbp9 (720) ;mRNA; r:279277-281924
MSSSSNAPAVLDKNTTFESFGIDARLLKALRKQNLEHPTLIQAQCIPLALEGKDVLAQARTGSGKTLAYCIPMVQRILGEKEGLERPEKVSPVRGLVLVPTRELSEQVLAVVEQLCASCHGAVRAVNLAGDLPPAAARARMSESPDVVVSTPGFLGKSMQFVDLARLSCVVLDEADLLLSYGYENDLQAVAQRLPSGCQGLLMSATLGDDVERVRRLVLHSPVVLKLEEPEAENALLKEHVLTLASEDQFLVLYALLAFKLVRGKALIFVNDIAKAFRLKLFLSRFGLEAAVLNSDLPFNCRYHTVQEFNSGSFKYLIATDMAGDDVDAGEIEEKAEEAAPEEHDADADEVDDAEDDDAEGEGEGDDDEDSEEGSDDEDAEMSVEEEDAESGAEKDDGEEEEVEEETPEGEGEGKKVRIKEEPSAQRSAKGSGSSSSGFNAARGIDFKDVSCVINFDLPATAKSYVHRVGRTGRGVKSGVAITFVLPELEEQFQQIAAARAEAGKEIKPYDIDMKMLDGLRYRASDVMRSVTGVQVRQARMLALKQEIANSKRLREHFSANPRELRMLKDQVRHDKVLLRRGEFTHLRTVPTELVPQELLSASPIAPLPKVVKGLSPQEEKRAQQLLLHKNNPTGERVYGEKRGKRRPLSKSALAARKKRGPDAPGEKPFKKQRVSKSTPEQKQQRAQRNKRGKDIKKLAQEKRKAKHERASASDHFCN